MTAAATKYLAPSDFGIVTSYFNPCRFRARAENFERFVAPIRAAGIPLVIVEARFEGEAFTLDERHQSLRVEARDLMWQKERLLDLGTGWLPPHCKKVAWLDADVLFEDQDWALRTSALLETSQVVQPFAEAVRLPRGALIPRPGDDTYQSFASMVVNHPEQLAHGKYALHGHTGFAWAARRDLVAQHGLYDASIGGSADHLMAHAFASDLSSRCITRMLGNGGGHLAHFRRWARRINAEVRGELTFTPGRLLHLWHGTLENRRYAGRNVELREHRFDPAEDIRIARNGCWEWASDKPALHAWSRRYFTERREDEDDESPSPSP